VRELAARHEREAAQAADAHRKALQEARHQAAVALEAARAEASKQVADANSRVKKEMQTLLEVELERCKEAEARRSQQHAVLAEANARKELTQAIAQREEVYVLG